MHRWRKLEGSDPQVFGLISKIKALQARIIAKTGKVVEREMMITRKEKVYQDLKQILSRQAGPELIDQLEVYKEHAAMKTKQSEKMGVL